MARSKTTKQSTVLESYNPATGEPLGSVPVTSPDEVAESLALARRAQRRWASLSPGERGARLKEFSKILLREADDVCARISAENGKTRQEALITEVLPTVDLINYYGKRADKFLKPKKIPLHLFKHRGSYIHYVPRGVVGIIAPWNFPFAIPIGETICALIAGNAVVLKPSEMTPLIAAYARSAMIRSGLPADLFQIIQGGPEVGKALVEAEPDMICFTGSVNGGRKVAEACGARLIPCVTELGGKAPAIICPDADMERTVSALAWGGFANSGQVCASVERVYAPASIHDDLVNRLVKKVRELRQGDPSSFDTDVGAICLPQQMDVVQELIDDAVANGAVVECGGNADSRSLGYFFEPTVLSNVNQNMRVAREEIFGPVIPIIKVDDVETALEYANDSHLGLTAYVFTRDRRKGRALAEKVEAGTVMVNDVMSTYGMPETPWHGIKNSGIGFVHSEDGLRGMCQMRHVHYERIPGIRRELWWYPYSRKTYQGIMKLMRVAFSKRSL